MKGIKEWIADINSNEELMKKFEGIEDSKEVVELAKKEGYEFTEDELMDLKMEAVSGGGIGRRVWKGLSTATRFILSDKSVKFLREITGND